MAAGVPGVGRMGVVMMQLVIRMVMGGAGMVGAVDGSAVMGGVGTFRIVIGYPSVVSFRIHTHPLLLDRLGAEKSA